MIVWLVVQTVQSRSISESAFLSAYLWKTPQDKQYKIIFFLRMITENRKRGCEIS